ncbi:MAG: CcoQ/FixQ family Cbb3-type cytochrome c oxidase assembly chaperone [Gemmatimonadetes bacterium]|nr:CcoQ/FixQ family Cbb3-type cytochrome c oxidase assembly chaperone [Gemmatimonadota bacterium]MBK9068093.1 CcoQ/FixQ family Cbb3-type cytochrome c oxidase assembly chaperone [Gemmatimonadota bacterium]
MNPLFREAAESVQLGWLLGTTTVLFLAAFLFWTWWAWTDKHKTRWEAASRLPFNDGGDA